MKNKYQELMARSTNSGKKEFYTFDDGVVLSVLVSKGWLTVGFWRYGEYIDLLDVARYRQELGIPYGSNRIPHRGHTVSKGLIGVEYKIRS